jgi:hypothetical protein
MNTADRRIAEVERYIHELAIALSGLPADEREDVIASIREHIDDSLLAIADPTPADVQRVLEELGDPLAIAADAGAPAPSPGPTHRPSAPSGPPPGGGSSPARTAGPTTAPAASNALLLEQEWVPLAMVGSFALAGALVWLGGRLGVVALTLWLVGLVILFAAPLWRTTEKVVGGLAFVIGPSVIVGLGLGYAPGAGVLYEFGSRPIELMLPRGYAPWPRLVEFGTSAFVVVALVAAGAWLLARGSARAREAARRRA